MSPPSRRADGEFFRSLLEENDMAKQPSTSSQAHSAGSSAAGPKGKVTQRDATAEQPTTSGTADDDPALAGSADPWAETDAGHPDENASDSLDQHPQSDDEASRNPGT
jgi:hypothetical protein